MGLIQALTTNRAWTSPDSPDPRLRGRVYPDPFARVWDAAQEIARGSRGWTIVESDPGRGEFAVEARTVLWRFVDDVHVRISLDGHGMTRVDLTSQSRVGKADLGVNARRIARFLHALDRRLQRAEADRKR